MECRLDAQITFPKGAWLFMWPLNFWHTIKHILKTASARDFKFGTYLRLWKAERAW